MAYETDRNWKATELRLGLPGTDERVKRMIRKKKKWRVGREGEKENQKKKKKGGRRKLKSERG